MAEVIREGYRQTKVGVIPEDWDVVKLGDVSQVTMGQSPSSSSYNEEGIGVPLIQGNADCKNRKTSPRVYTSEKTKECFIDDIIMTVRAPVGAVSKSLHDACIGRGVCAIKAKKKNQYLYHFLVGYESKWEKYSQGSTFTAVNSKDVKNLKIPLPPLKEQQKIAQILTTWDDTISKQETLIKAKEKLKKGLMQKLLSGEVRFDGFDGEWGEVRLGDVVDFHNGKAHEKNIAENGKYTVINSKFISTEGAVQKYSDKIYLGANVSDIVMVMSDVPNGRAIAKCFFIDVENKYTINQRICLLKSKKTNSKFLFYILNRHRYYLSFDDGVKQTNLKKEDVLSCPLKIPSEEEQKKIADVLTFADKEINLLKNELEVLKEQKRGLMQRLLSGEVRVKVI